MANEWADPIDQPGVVVPSRQAVFHHVDRETGAPIRGSLLHPSAFSASALEMSDNLLRAVLAVPEGSRIHKRSDGDAAVSLVAFLCEADTLLAETSRSQINTDDMLSEKIDEGMAKLATTREDLVRECRSRSISFDLLFMHPESVVNALHIDVDVVGLVLDLALEQYGSAIEAEIGHYVPVGIPPITVVDALGYIPGLGIPMAVLSALEYSSIPDMTQDDFSRASRSLFKLVEDGVVSSVTTAFSDTDERLANKIVGLPIAGTVPETAGDAAVRTIALGAGALGARKHIHGAGPDWIRESGFASASEWGWHVMLPELFPEAGRPARSEGETPEEDHLDFSADMWGNPPLGWADAAPAEHNRPPEASPQLEYTIPYGITEPLYRMKDPEWYDTGCLVFTDPDGDVLSINLEERPRIGMLDILVHGVEGMYSVTLQYKIDRAAALAAHRGDLSYADHFRLVATDPHGASAATQVVIKLDVINTLPECELDDVTTPAGQAIVVDVLANDSDVDGDALTLMSAGTPSHGTAVISGSEILYTPEALYIGDDSFTYSIDDGYGGSATGTVTVRVVDATPPVFVNPPAGPGTVGSDPGVCGAVVSWTAPVIGVDITDNIGIDSVTVSHSSGTFFDVGTTTVTYTATDLAGNQATHSFDVVVNDQEEPTFFDVPENLSVALVGTEAEVAVIWTPPTATDNCVVASLTGSHTPGETFTKGTTPVTYTATDIHGNVSEATFYVIVDGPLQALCPNVTVTTRNDMSDPVIFSGSASGGCHPIDYDFDPPSGTRFELGTTTEVLCTATDACGVVDSCVFNVTVSFENRAPVAVDDSGEATGGFCSVDVIANDSDPDGDDIHVASVGTGACGDAYLDADGRTVHFVAMNCDNMRGVWISISYVVEDTHGLTDTGILQVKIPETGSLPQSPGPES